jgi:hypothetical protein
LIECADTHDFLDGHPKKLLLLQEELKDEYVALTSQECEDLVEEFTIQQDERTKVKQPSPKAHIADVANVVWNMQLLVCRFIKILTVM